VIALVVGCGGIREMGCVAVRVRMNGNGSHDLRSLLLSIIVAIRLRSLNKERNVWKSGDLLSEFLGSIRWNACWYRAESRRRIVARME